MNRGLVPFTPGALPGVLSSILLILSCVMGSDMVNRGKATLSVSESGCVLYLHAGLVNDSTFPFAPGDRLEARIEGRRLVVERVSEPNASEKC